MLSLALERAIFMKNKKQFFRNKHPATSSKDPQYPQYNILDKNISSAMDSGMRQ